MKTNKKLSADQKALTTMSAKIMSEALNYAIHLGMDHTAEFTKQGYDVPRLCFEALELALDVVERGIAKDLKRKVRRKK